MITGFPGETEEEFAQTVAFCREIGFARMHVFPYSARQGTVAAQMPGQVPNALREERARRLIAVGEDLVRSFRAAQVGRTVAVLVEETDEEGLARGYTAEYMLCRFPDGRPGQMAQVTVTGFDGDGLIGKAASMP